MGDKPSQIERLDRLLDVCRNALSYCEERQPDLSRSLAERMLALGSMEDAEGRLVCRDAIRQLANQAHSEGDFKTALELFPQSMALDDPRSFGYFVDLLGIIRSHFDPGRDAEGFAAIAWGVCTYLSAEVNDLNRYNILSLICMHRFSKTEPEHINGPFLQAIRDFVLDYKLMPEDEFDARWAQCPAEVLSFLETEEDRPREAGDGSVARLAREQAEQILREQGALFEPFSHRERYEGLVDLAVDAIRPSRRRSGLYNRLTQMLAEVGEADDEASRYIRKRAEELRAMA